MLVAMRVIVLGAGHVGRTIVHALHEQHDISVIGLDPRSLAAIADRYDVRTVLGDGTTRRIVQKAGADQADLLIACSPREEANLVCAILVKRLSGAKTVVRSTSMELLEAWREGELDIDFMVSPELETANAVAGVVGLPAACRTDVFAEGRVQVVEFDVPPDASDDTLVGRPLRTASLPRESKVVGIVRGGQMIVPRGAEEVRRGDRIVVIASPESARAWSERLRGRGRGLDDIVVFGAGRMGTTIARVLLERGLRVRIVDARADRAQAVAEDLPEARVFHADGFDRSFLDRQRITDSAGVFCTADDARNLFGAVLAKVHGVQLAITLVHDPDAADVYARAGVDVAINPREVTAEEMVRFAHDPRITQIAMLEGDRFEILDITVRPGSELAHTPFRDLPDTGSVIGAVIRDGTVLFPHGSDVLEAGDRVIVFVESARASIAERAL
jgi:trk system potassium uptake protein TrkA